MIYVVGLGYNESEYTDEIKSLVEKYPVYVRSDWHPIIKKLGFNYESFDYIYEKAETFDDVYSQIVDTLVEKSENKTIVYIVMGSAYVAEKTVKLLQERTEVEIVNGISFIEKIINYLGIDPIDGLQVVDGLSDFSIDLKSNVIVAQVYSRIRASEVKLKLLEFYDDLTDIMILDSIGVFEKEKKIECKLYELDRFDCFDHLTSVYIKKPDNRRFTLKDIEFNVDYEDNYVDELEMTERLENILKSIEFHAKEGYYNIDDIIKNIVKKQKK